MHGASLLRGFFVGGASSDYQVKNPQWFVGLLIALGGPCGGGCYQGRFKLTSLKYFTVFLSNKEPEESCFHSSIGKEGVARSNFFEKLGSTGVAS